VINEADRQRLLRAAREAIVAHVSGEEVDLPTGMEVSDSLGRPGAAFVSIHHGGELRGCIGHLEAKLPLLQVVCECAVAASSADPRFPAISPVELPGLEIELSVLGPFEPLASAEELEVGRHGLFVERQWQRGLLLPQVATEWGWDRETFLAQTCHKAGLPRDAWKKDAKVWRFEAEVFAEGRIGP
jgi:AmmeMemoRadiSam system protein A